MKALILSELTEDIKTRIERDLHLEIIDRSADNLGNHEILKHLLREHDPEVVVISSHRFQEEEFAAGKRLCLIICTRGNPANVDREKAAEKGVVLTSTPGRNANAVAEFTIGLIICAMRSIPQAYKSICDRESTLAGREDIDGSKKDVVWLHESLPYKPYLRFRGSEICDKKLGLIGMGAIGTLVAEKAKAMGMDILVNDPYIDAGAVSQRGYAKRGFKALLKQADVISLHAKVTKDTVNLIGIEELKTMKNSAVLINTARGALIDHDALLAALRECWIRMAALDVFSYEPLHRGDPLLDLPNLIFTPHIGGASEDVVRHHSRMAFESLEDFVKGKSPIRYRVGG
jgi:D-3-phosphoglycerate dehydrogenase